MKVIIGLLLMSMVWAENLDEKFMDDILKPIKNRQINGKSFDDIKQHCLSDELVVSSIQEKVISNLKNDIEQGRMTSLVKSLGGIFPNLKNVNYKKFDDISIAKVIYNNLNLDVYLKDFKISNATIDIVDYTIPIKNRSDKSEPGLVHLKTRFNFRGLSSTSGNKRQDRGEMILSFNNEKGEWRLIKSQIRNVENLKSNKKSTFKKMNIPALASVPVELRTEAIRRGGYALASSDINNDTYTDILVATKSGLHLFMGSADGFYKQKDSRLDGLSYVKTAVFADFDNSGHKDLVLTRLVTVPNKKGEKAKIGVEVFKGNGKGQFTNVTTIEQGKKLKFLEPMPAAVADFNNDGLLDFYVGYPGKQDFTTRGQTATGYRPQGVYINKGNFKFSDFTDKFTGFDNFDRKLFPHASLAVNFDQKHGTDLLVIDDRGNLSPMFKNNGLNFDESAEEIGLGNRGYGMSIAVGDYSNDGLTDIVFTNVNFASAKRFQSACSNNYSYRMDVPGAQDGLRLFKGFKSGKFDEVKGRGLEDTGYGAAGVTFVDYNYDGHQDIYLVNGLWSGEFGGNDLDSQFLTAVNTTNDGLVHSLKAEDYSGFKEFLFKARGHYDYKNQKWVHSSKGKRPSLAGYQHNRLFRNNGDGTFVEVGYFEGVDSIADGYVVSKIDLNNDGIEDLVLRNSDPGTKEYQYDPVEVFINTRAPKEKQYAIRLKGTHSPQDAFGSFVIAKTNKGKRVQHLIANSGASQDDSVLRFFLSKGEKLTGLDVHWSSGQKDVYKSIPLKTTLTEKSKEKMAAR